MSKGVRFDGYTSKKCEIWAKGKSTNTFHIILTEGKKRQIRRMCEALHHEVVDLKRIRIMNVELGKIKEGEYQKIEGQELDIFLKSLSLK
jgi:23S rRNA pseudouridine2604 synthase